MLFSLEEGRHPCLPVAVHRTAYILPPGGKNAIFTASIHRFRPAAES